MEENKTAKGMYITITLLEDRIRLQKNEGFTKKSDESYDEVMLEDIDLNGVEYSPARSMFIQGYLLIPLHKKLSFPNSFNGKTKEVKLWFKKDGNEEFEKFKEILMEKR